ncbi:beta-1,6-N-acetylglucosaminyltransferase [Bifidobacterium amazonense]|uniref:Peptide O-xylosyltransferase n=1 Tax=Bifidobacterium amazonense TaxID=2809027 RepID=A0ABS9VYF4_9BIFI|nr:beta-1,6-N-acetylglucosaminyltransferase [Bifidobacterium amazonense]MCH9276845.1 beta-1,6-N-acetylglucosaminyltransferase [Bifidobacterium amazonense]
MTSRHAYLLMVHKSIGQVEKLCRLLDDNRNDLYVHVDDNVRDVDIWQTRLHNAVKNAKLVFVPRVAVSWGGFSQIKAELSLLDTAVNDRTHTYYHLISGADLPLRNQDQIHSFFDMHQGKEFVSLGTLDYQKTIESRVRYWYIWQEYIGNAHSTLRRILRKVQRAYIALQRVFDVNLNSHNDIKHYYGGANWFSITESFAIYILAHRDWIHDTFRKGKCVDEVFVQTLLLNSEFSENRYLGVQFDDGPYSIMRDIDWKRGHPYVWRSGDFNELISSDFLFARKFDEDIDGNIIDRIYKFVVAE